MLNPGLLPEHTMPSHICASIDGIPTAWKVLPVFLTYPYSPSSAQALDFQGNLPTQPDSTGIPSPGLSCTLDKPPSRQLYCISLTVVSQRDGELPEGRSFDILSLYLQLT